MSGSRASRRATGGPVVTGRAHRALAGAALVGTLLALTGCASTVDSIERLGRKAAERVGTQEAKPPRAAAATTPSRPGRTPPGTATG
ncbi:hypothetical protein [Streptomyces sp. NPDC002057]|uniref:hypothetical protein n=1 Tax=Streptomyces sp. NPDC002057 TaxID=3154664 RepID=UPI003331A880